MTIFYAASTGGFYDDAIHSSRPADCVEISHSHRDWLLEQQSATSLITADANGYPVITERVFSEAEHLHQMRSRRDGLLRETDMTQIPDYPISAELRTAWASYRQQLRDLPETTTDPADIIWPEPPTGASA